MFASRAFCEDPCYRDDFDDRRDYGRGSPMRVSKMNTSDGMRNAGRIDLEAAAKLTPEQKNALAAAAKQELGVPETPRLRGERADLRPDPKRIRERLRLSQQQFAQRFGLRVKTIRHWEQQRTAPDRPAVVLLKTIEIAPDVVEEAVLALSRPRALLDLDSLPLATSWFDLEKNLSAIRGLLVEKISTLSSNDSKRFVA